MGSDPTWDPEPPTELHASIQARLAGEGSVSFNLTGRTPFQRAVLELVASIPRGEVRSYQEVAEQIGHPGAARAVGEVMRTNPIPVLIPCHRVVRSDGSIGRYTPEPSIKRHLLEEEGVL
jgi:methylated-DNA-[protein]-cysteine S-methyltransferase